VRRKAPQQRESEIISYSYDAILSEPVSPSKVEPEQVEETQIEQPTRKESSVPKKSLFADRNLENLVEFDKANDKFKFNVLGLQNTKRESAFYRVDAKIAHHSFEFKAADWDQCTQTMWRFEKEKDRVVSGSSEFKSN